MICFPLLLQAWATIAADSSDSEAGLMRQRYKAARSHRVGLPAAPLFANGRALTPAGLYSRRNPRLQRSRRRRCGSTAPRRMGWTINAGRANYSTSLGGPGIGILMYG